MYLYCLVFLLCFFCYFKRSKTSTKLTQKRKSQNHLCSQHRVVNTPNLSAFLTFAAALWFGSSRDFSAPIPRDGSCVWKTVTLPPVGDISLKAACNAGPRALWVSRDLVNICGNVFSRSWISYKWENCIRLKTLYGPNSWTQPSINTSNIKTVKRKS